jgi:GTPase
MSHIEHSKNLPKIAIIGRPNVGKSSLFNRILRRRKAIVEAVSGVTRDKLGAFVKFSNTDFMLIDTGGIVPSSREKIESLVYAQSRDAINESDAVIFVCDIKTGITLTDEHIADILKKNNAKTFLAINKVDDKSLENDASVFYKLGLNAPYAISAINNKGIDILIKDVALFARGLDKSRQHLLADKDESACINIAVVGMPNVGKSSFINTILDKQRLIVDDVPGTTRDSVDISIKRHGRILTIVDTAGMRHKKKFRDVIEVFSLSRARESIKRCDVAFVMIDGSRLLTRDDLAVLTFVIKAGKACVLLVNKMDLLSDVDFQEYKKNLIHKYRPIEWMPVIFTSCKNKSNIIKALDTACSLYDKSKISIPTPSLNKFLVKLQKQKPPVSHKGIRPKILYATQTSVAPCRFVLFCTRLSFMDKEYLRFVERQMRVEFNLHGIPLDFQLRSRKKEAKSGV